MRHSGGLLLAATLLCLDAVVAVPVAEDALPVLLPQKKHGLGPRIMRGIVQLRQLHIRGAVRFHELVWRRRSPKTNRDGRRVAEVVRSFLVAGLRISPKEGYPDFANEKAIRPGNLLYGEYKLYPDHSWAQVMRFGSGCNAGIEGLSAGWPTDCGSNYTKMGRPELSNCTRLGQGSPARVGYGCWFFFSDPFVYRSNQTAKLVLGHASGVAVNVGKSLRVDTRADASAALALPCDNPPLCDKENTVQDKLYCERANLLGYDSIQFARPHYACKPDHCPEGSQPGYSSELLMCTAGCMTQTVLGSCPPGVELRQVDAYGKVLSPKHSPCNCNDWSDVVNCGDGSKLYGKPITGVQACYASEDDYKPNAPLIIQFPEIRDIHQWHGCKCDQRRNDT